MPFYLRWFCDFRFTAEQHNKHNFVKMQNKPTKDVCSGITNPLSKCKNNSTKYFCSEITNVMLTHIARWSIPSYGKGPLCSWSHNVSIALCAVTRSALQLWTSYRLPSYKFVTLTRYGRHNALMHYALCRHSAWIQPRRGSIHASCWPYGFDTLLKG